MSMSMSMPSGTQPTVVSISICVISPRSTLVSPAPPAPDEVEHRCLAHGATYMAGTLPDTSADLLSAMSRLTFNACNHRRRVTPHVMHATTDEPPPKIPLTPGVPRRGRQEHAKPVGMMKGLTMFPLVRPCSRLSRLSESNRRPSHYE